MAALVDAVTMNGDILLCWCLRSTLHHRVTIPRVALPLLPFSELQHPLPSEG